MLGYYPSIINRTMKFKGSHDLCEFAGTHRDSKFQVGSCKSHQSHLPEGQF